MSDDKVRIRMTEGSGFVTSNFYYQFSKAPASELSLDAWIDGSLLDGWNEANDEQRTLLPEGNYDFPDGKTLSLSAENQRSALKRIRFMAENLAPGEYYLPLTVAEEAGTEEHQTINYLISIRARQLGEYKLNADQVLPYSISTRKNTSRCWWMNTSCPSSMPIRGKMRGASGKTACGRSVTLSI
jgi:glycosyl hydrolases family 18